MDYEIEEMVKKCQICQELRPTPLAAPLDPWEWPKQPWSQIHLDFAGPFMGYMFLIIIDSCSKWIDVQLMQSKSASKTTEKLRIVFATDQCLPVLNSGSLWREMISGRESSSSDQAGSKECERRKCSRKVFVYVLHHTSYDNRGTTIRIVNGSPS